MAPSEKQTPEEHLLDLPVVLTVELAALLRLNKKTLYDALARGESSRATRSPSTNTYRINFPSRSSASAVRLMLEPIDGSANGSLPIQVLPWQGFRNRRDKPATAEMRLAAVERRSRDAGVGCGASRVFDLLDIMRKWTPLYPRRVRRRRSCIILLLPTFWPGRAPRQVDLQGDQHPQRGSHASAGSPRRAR